MADREQPKIPEPEMSDVPTPEQIAGRPLVDLTATELQDVAREVDLEGRSSMKRNELIVALGGDPDAMTEAERVEAAAEVAKREAENDSEDLLSADPHDRIAAVRCNDEIRAAEIEANSQSEQENTEDQPPVSDDGSKEESA